MAYFVTTALGREVPLGDWKALHGDTVLKVLLDYRMSPFNPQNQPLAVAPLANATGLSPADTLALCEALRDDDLVELVGQGQARITGNGVVYARNAGPQIGHRRGVL